jgi:hypothetical protein
MERITKIYLVENIEPGTNKVYIGKTIDSRKSAHKSTYGSQISYTYIDEVPSLNYNDWEPVETYWIEQFKQWGFDVVNKRKQGGSGASFHKEETKANINKANYSNIEYHVGDILKTDVKVIPGKIALLRLDTDWYESTKFELENFEKNVVKEGFIIIDDYSYDLYPLTENFSKGKLPIGNKPLIFY